MPSRRIKLQRSIHHIRRPEVEVRLIQMGSVKTLNSYWNKQGNIGTGLTWQETEYLLPQIVGLKADNVEFAKEVAKFYANMNIEVPETGVEFEVGLSHDNTKPVGKIKEGKEEVENRPIEPLQYLKFKFLAGHPQVAFGEQEAINIANKPYVLIDESEKEMEEELKLREAEKATNNFYSIQENNDKVNQLLALLGFDFTVMNKVQKKKKLKEIADTEPTRFNEAFNDELAEYKFFVEQCLSFDVLEDVGGRILEKESQRELGANKREAALHLRDAANSDTYRKLTALLKSAKK
jgi:hypothetical protein